MHRSRIPRPAAAGAALFFGAALLLWAASAPAHTGSAGHEGMNHPGMTHEGMSHEKGEGPGHSHEQCELHGGQVAMTAAHHVETVAAPEGIRVYLYNENQQPLPSDKVSGTVTLKDRSGRAQELKLTPFKPGEGDPAVYYCTMYDSPATTSPGNCPVCGMKLVPQTGLKADTDLSRQEPGRAEAIVHLTGLAGEEKELTVTAKLRPQGKVAPQPSSRKPDDGHEHTSDMK